MALTQQLAGRAAGSPVQVCAHADTRRGFLPIVRRRITAGGYNP
jgi:hypothetical protein